MCPKRHVLGFSCLNTAIHVFLAISLHIYYASKLFGKEFPSRPREDIRERYRTFIRGRAGTLLHNLDMKGTYLAIFTH